MDLDPVIRRLQWGAVIWCAVAASVALLVWPRRLDVAAGVTGGGLLTGVSFYAIKPSIDALLGLMDGSVADGARRGVAVRAMARMVGRYALLAVLAYVMIARLRLHPIGLVIGASALVASAVFEAGRRVARTP